MNDVDRNEARIARLLAATRAQANPAVLARARARLAARAAAPGMLAWLGRPAALAAACVLLLASAGVSYTLLRGEPATSSSETSLVSSLLDDDGTYGLPHSVASGGASGRADSGEVTP